MTFYHFNKGQEVTDEELDNKIDLRMHMDMSPYTIHEVSVLQQQKHLQINRVALYELILGIKIFPCL